MAVKTSSLSSNSLQGVGSSGSADRTEQAKGGQSLHKTIGGSDDSDDENSSLDDFFASL